MMTFATDHLSSLLGRICEHGGRFIVFQGSLFPGERLQSVSLLSDPSTPHEGEVLLDPKCLLLP